MNQYLYPWHDLEGNNQIGTIQARNYSECEEKLSQKLLDKYANTFKSKFAKIASYILNCFVKWIEIF